MWPWKLFLFVNLLLLNIKQETQAGILKSDKRNILSNLHRLNTDEDLVGEISTYLTETESRIALMESQLSSKANSEDVVSQLSNKADSSTVSSIQNEIMSLQTKVTGLTRCVSKEVLFGSGDEPHETAVIFNGGFVSKPALVYGIHKLVGGDAWVKYQDLTKDGVKFVLSEDKGKAACRIMYMACGAV